MGLNALGLDWFIPPSLPDWVVETGLTSARLLCFMVHVRRVGVLVGLLSLGGFVGLVEVVMSFLVSDLRVAAPFGGGDLSAFLAMIFGGFGSLATDPIGVDCRFCCGDEDLSS